MKELGWLRAFEREVFAHGHARGEAREDGNVR
jgi:hypothetical protein